MLFSLLCILVENVDWKGHLVVLNNSVNGFPTTGENIVVKAVEIHAVEGDDPSPSKEYDHQARVVFEGDVEDDFMSARDDEACASCAHIEGAVVTVLSSVVVLLSSVWKLVLINSFTSLAL
ncbi:unnamed protein product [Strongylus vulgaris]|uniref:Uncharacterized protein n=1 Tax=Strongylus vulgaris TaxID=40348 RepID=A0A3P7KIV1_STRVU|nr:unnamed protein product [Strongylus vulgaris]